MKKEKHKRCTDQVIVVPSCKDVIRHNVRKYTTHFKIINLGLLLSLVWIPSQFAANAAETSKTTQPAQQAAKLQSKRPLVISQLKTSGISVAERIALKPKHVTAKPEQAEQG